MTVLSTPACSSDIAQLCLSTCGVNAFVVQRRASLGRGGDVDRDATLDGIAAQAPAGARREERIPWLTAALGKPHGEDRLGLLGEWDRALLASLALYADVAAGAKRDIAAVDGDQLGHPQAGLEREHQHRAVAAALPALLRWRVDQRLGLLRA